jgi:CheY-like chemotaxis protein
VAEPVRALVVDDDDDIRRLYEEVLDHAEDFIVVGVARDGVEAIGCAIELQPDLVLLDIRMPVLDGIAALPGIRSAAPEARVVLFTALGVLGLNEDRIAKAAPDAILLKTLTPAALLGELRRLLARPQPGGSP